MGEVRSDVRTMPIYQTDQNRAEPLNPNPVTHPNLPTPDYTQRETHPSTAASLEDRVRLVGRLPASHGAQATPARACAAPPPGFSLARFTHYLTCRVVLELVLASAGVHALALCEISPA